jgi:membrane-bound ClpP family serine protease
MTLIVILFMAGVLLLAFEVIVPGAVLGIVGGLLFLAGTLVSFARFGFEGGLLAGGLAAALLGLALYLEFVVLPKSRLAKTFSMTATVAGTSQPPVADAAVVGRTAVAATALVPSGYVEIGGRRYEAFSRSGHAAAGETLEVVGVDTFRLIVSKPSTPQTS